MSWTPRGKIKTLIDAMSAPGAAALWGADDAADAARVPRKSISSYLNAALKHEVLFKAIVKGRLFLSLKPFPEEEQAERAPFNAALWVDGDLCLYGLEELEGGGYKLAADHVPALKRLLEGVQ